MCCRVLTDDLFDLPSVCAVSDDGGCDVAAGGGCGGFGGGLLVRIAGGRNQRCHGEDDVVLARQGALNRGGQGFLVERLRHVVAYGDQGRNGRRHMCGWSGRWKRTVAGMPIEVALVDKMAGGKAAQWQQEDESHARHATGRDARDNPVSWMGLQPAPCPLPPDRR